jgi:hypothetical protein
MRRASGPAAAVVATETVRPGCMLPRLPLQGFSTVLKALRSCGPHGQQLVSSAAAARKGRSSAAAGALVLLLLQPRGQLTSRMSPLNDDKALLPAQGALHAG